MAKPRQHLRNAPIVEAVVDFRVRPRDELLAADLEPLALALGPSYSERSQIFSGQWKVEIGKDGPTPPHQTVTTEGCMLRSHAAAEVVQLRTSGLTFSKLKPYTNWDQVFSTVLNLWRQYLELTRPPEVTRIAVRYVNQFDLPPGAQLEKYLRAAPRLPRPMPQILSEYLSRVVVQDERTRAMAVVTQAIRPPALAGQISLLLDIDAFRNESLEPDQDWEGQFSSLRQLKNRIFYASVTEQALEPYL